MRNRCPGVFTTDISPDPLSVYVCVEGLASKL